MKYKFKKYNLSSLSTPESERIYEYSVDYDTISTDEKALFNIGSHLQTPQKVQELIDESLALEDEDELEYKADGSNLFMIIDKGKVYFYNSLENKKEEDFIWPIEKFIQFLQDFKQFVAENS